MFNVTCTLRDTTSICGQPEQSGGEHAPAATNTRPRRSERSRENRAGRTEHDGHVLRPEPAVSGRAADHVTVNSVDAPLMASPTPPARNRWSGTQRPGGVGEERRSGRADHEQRRQS